MEITITNRIDLKQDDMPGEWYNIIPDLPKQLPMPKNSSGKAIDTLKKVILAMV
ncbi:MAG: hypothetical protein RXN92_04995 [Thermoplasmatales archaeon]